MESRDLVLIQRYINSENQLITNAKSNETGWSINDITQIYSEHKSQKNIHFILGF